MTTVHLDSVNTGSTANSGDGSTIRDAFTIVNSNTNKLNNQLNGTAAQADTYPVTNISATGIISANSGAMYGLNIYGGIVFSRGSEVLTSSSGTWNGGNVSLYGIFSNTEASTSTTTGMLQAYGGVGIRGNINVGGTVNTIAGNLAVSGVFSSGNASVGTLSASGATTVGALTVAGTTTFIGNVTAANANVAGTLVAATLIASNVSFGTLPTLTVAGASTLNTVTAASVQAPAIGNITPGTAAFTTLSVSSTSAHTGAATFTTLTAGGIQSTAIGNVTPGTGAFTSVLASNVTSSGNLVTTNGLFWANGINVLSTFAAASALYANTNVAAYLPTYTGAVQASSILPNANVTANIGSSTAWFSNVHAITFRGTSTTAQYADLAEVYESDADYEPGTVLVFGTDTEVTMSTRHEDNRVAGVVTTNPAYLMNSDATGVAVALQGRVPCRVVGTIRRGDMMVTSTTPGVATACMPPFGPHIGTVIGKALQNYDSGEPGVIEIVVGRV
jgi:hypothetical protein